MIAQLCLDVGSDMSGEMRASLYRKEKQQVEIAKHECLLTLVGCSDHCARLADHHGGNEGERFAAAVPASFRSVSTSPKVVIEHMCNFGSMRLRNAACGADSRLRHLND
jgi:hypothetical protein